MDNKTKTSLFETFMIAATVSATAAGGYLTVSNWETQSKETIACVAEIKKGNTCDHKTIKTAVAELDGNQRMTYGLFVMAMGIGLLGGAAKDRDLRLMREENADLKGKLAAKNQSPAP